MRIARSRPTSFPSRRFVLAAALAGALTTGGRSVVLACDCLEATVEQAVGIADAVFRGRVVDRVMIDELDYRCAMEIETVWKGPVLRRLHVETDFFCGGPPMEVGETYIVYARTETDELAPCELPPWRVRINGCLRSREDDPEEAAALGTPLWHAPHAFQRGDANDDGELSISDAVYTLQFLFSGGPGLECEDAGDANDDGGLALSDPIYTLNWLFLGGPRPPAPGPTTRGYDPTPDGFDCGGGLAPECPAAVYRSTLPGVRLEIVSAPCRLTLDEAAAGVTFTYRTVVDEAIDVVSRPTGSCQQPGASGLHVLPRLVGGDESYCLCDLGKCFFEVNATTLQPGSEIETFTWCGKSWFGPSDFNNPLGPPFPPGVYTFRLEAVGTWEGDAETPYSITAELEIEIVE